MKWVVFRGIGGDEDSKKVMSYLKKKQVICKAFKFDLAHLSEPDDKNMTSTITTLCEILADATHVVLVNIEQIPIVGTFLYALGLISQKSVFMTGERHGLPTCLTNSFFPTCIDIDELYDRLDKYFPIFQEEEKKEIARHQLFSLNIPLNPDAFAHHLCAGNEDECNIFYAAGMDVDSTDSAGTPMICNAARAGQLYMINWLIEKNANIDAVSKDRGYSAIMDAIGNKDKDTVAYLVQKNANLDIVSKDGQPIAVLAAGTGNVEICKLLVGHNVDVHKKDNLGMSGLDYANLFRHEKIVEAFSSVQK